MTRLGTSSYHSDSDEYHSFTGNVEATTDKAVLFWFDDLEEKHWIPRKCCAAGGEDIKMGDKDIEIAEWFCEKEGLI